LEELKNLIDVDVYGQCGKNLCDDEAAQGSQDEHDCFNKISKNYLFVMPVESDNCSALLTPKVIAILQSSSIPVVLNASLMSALGPLTTIIHRTQYKSPKDLADYLNNVGTDYNKYKLYLEWKRRYRIRDQRRDFCKLCHLLNNPESIKPNNAKYKNLAEWLEKDKCPYRKPKDTKNP
jgi:hypothetical protein